ncbi:MAG: hypothetical protein A2487_01210 [Candidatus Raymondbacteria bacterium RifOxyC12_full_50_8]|uniref:Radical SAM core domain-containing protein n=1 Tax=Candidatus Raymondbacteria bacterium RIFOXYD12_FULL_49_13 TaxID=1817890 RepID=A0A1F7F9E8_UNCRA|nr:MAG: hypothetical protein A2248_09720 [Candidatus Raymondbacteria bacterium RIFOXYA2_FULL_49_16]OGJ91840.1 MAG: hypothetical protein A2350_21440 [Candidatus Raymondbacteria bacterium RifOxyB12_full_50_8]OGJ95501.1 MAG: hypothetical protein A2487_01210 [Candidatus Raymondbacteria bacterium RifOxyC12_full_50_8]OGJ97181.1 MAG: hypothetical protein A2453_10365 [Candidatus Raymondbacteria bacterium RIFOXYC2_FULL_50_21]OGK03208.1 MAG: hypothetical protein A2519_05115 [Candidatus Raymondbacteria ba
MIAYFLEKRTPVIAYLEVTMACNVRCIHCYREKTLPKPRDELTRKEINVLLDELARLGTLILVVTGGEPFMRPDIMEILSDARKKGFAVVVFTNATLISGEHARALYDIAPLGVEVSIHGSNAQVHDSITGVKGSFAKAMAAIALLKEHCIRVKMKGNLMRANKCDYDSLIKVAEDLDLEWTFDPFIFPCRDGNAAPIGQRPGHNSLAKVFSEPRFARPGVHQPERSYLEMPGNRLCGAGVNIVAIGSTGRVFPCVPLKLEAGNIRIAPIGHIWRKSPVFEKLRSYRVRDLVFCGDCDLKKYCPRCSAMSFNETGDLLGCAAISRSIAQARKRTGGRVSQRLQSPVDTEATYA